MPLDLHCVMQNATNANQFGHDLSVKDEMSWTADNSA